MIIKWLLLPITKIMNDLNTKMNAAINVVQGKGDNVKGNIPKGTGRGKGDHAKGDGQKGTKGKGRGQGNHQQISSSDYPANILCPHIDKGEDCPAHDTQEGCQFMHPEDGNRSNEGQEGETN